jgi:hypothetical protein
MVLLHLFFCQQRWLPTPTLLQQWWLPMVNGWCCPFSTHAMATTQQSPPLQFMWGNCPLASSVQACILHLFQAYHSESVCGQVYRYSPNLSITRVTKAHLFSHKRITTTRWYATSHLKSVNACLWDTTFPFERINHARSGMIHQASHQGLQHPLKRKFLFPSATVII